MNRPSEVNRGWAWNRVTREEREYWSEPSGEVMAFTSRLKKVGFNRVYDLGCGIGRHAAYLAKHGFEVYASDTSAHGLKETQMRLNADGVRADVLLSDLTSIPFADTSFDALIAFNVVYHAVRADVEACLSEAQRVLRRGGLFFVTFLSTRDNYLENGSGRRIDQCTVIKAGGPEDGVPHYFIDREELDRLMGSFELLRITHSDEWHPELDKTDRSSHWVVWAQKP